MPAFAGTAEWLGSEPLGPAELRGHVVVVNFWTLTCINWLRQEPYIRAWSQAYRDEGLIVIGVHTPEFSFEHEIDRIRKAIQEREIDYPVAVDNEFEIWERSITTTGLRFISSTRRASSATSTSAKDATAVRARHPAAPRRAARIRLRRRARRRGASRLEPRPDARDISRLRAQRAFHASRRCHAQGHAYQLPNQLEVNHWALAGDWTIGSENVVLDQAGGSIAFRFHARDAHLVLCARARAPIPFRVLLDGEAPGRQQASTSTRTETACSGTDACTSSSANPTPSTSTRFRSPSSNAAPRRTCSRSASAAVGHYTRPIEVFPHATRR